MTLQPILTTEDLIQLGQGIHDHGFAPNEERITEVVEAARSILPDLEVLDVLADRATVEVVRARALSHLVREWAGIQPELELRKQRFDQALDELLSAWLEHQDLKDSTSDVARLVESRQRLDSTRLVADRSRQVLSSCA